MDIRKLFASSTQKKRKAEDIDLTADLASDVHTDQPTSPFTSAIDISKLTRNQPTQPILNSYPKNYVWKTT